MVAVADRDHWARWSLIAFFDAANDVKTDDYPVYLEGDIRTTALLRNFAEVRLDGPDFIEQTKNKYRLEVVFNLLVNSKVDPQDLYAIERVMGQFQRAFAKCIPVYKKGGGALDDESLLGEYHLFEGVDQDKFGIIEKDTQLMQVSLEAHYRMSL